MEFEYIEVSDPRKSPPIMMDRERAGVVWYSVDEPIGASPASWSLTRAGEGTLVRMYRYVGHKQAPGMLMATGLDLGLRAAWSFPYPGRIDLVRVFWATALEGEEGEQRHVLYLGLAARLAAEKP